MNPSQFPKSLVGKHSRKTVVFCGSNQCPWIWNQIHSSWNVHILYAIILNCMQRGESIKVWSKYIQWKLAEKVFRIHFITINVLYQTSVRRPDVCNSVRRCQKHIRTRRSLFWAFLMDAALSWMLNPGQNPAGEGGFRGGWKGCTTRVPQFIMAWTVWHKQGGLDRPVVKKPREGINDSEDLWPPSPSRERVGILWFCASNLTVSFSLLLLRYLLSFQQQDFLQGDSSKAQKILGWKPKVTFEVCVVRLQAGTSSLIWLRMFLSMSTGREVFSSVMEDQAKIANGH